MIHTREITIRTTPERQDLISKNLQMWQIMYGGTISFKTNCVFVVEVEFSEEVDIHGIVDTMVANNVIDPFMEDWSC